MPSLYALLCATFHHCVISCRRVKFNGRSNNLLLLSSTHSECIVGCTKCISSRKRCVSRLIKNQNKGCYDSSGSEMR